MGRIATGVNADERPALPASFTATIAPVGPMPGLFCAGCRDDDLRGPGAAGKLCSPAFTEAASAAAGNASPDSAAAAMLVRWRAGEEDDVIDVFGLLVDKGLLVETYASEAQGTPADAGAQRGCDASAAAAGCKVAVCVLNGAPLASGIGTSRSSSADLTSSICSASTMPADRELTGCCPDAAETPW